ncbi:MAG: glycosyltransferase family 39 protein [Melioribacteraceae bacterium]|nr:glycosyltransferase family 39 protein [Melioribacteraceae bacterium]
MQKIVSFFKSKFYFAILIVPILLITKIHFADDNLVFNYSSLWILSSIFYLLSVIIVNKNEIKSYQIMFLIFISLTTQLSFINFDPIGSDDIYRYIWDGKVQANNINPYLYKPIDNELDSLHSDLLPAKMNFKEMKTIYFPLSQWLFFISYKISEESFWGFKFLIFISIILSYFLTYKLLKVLNHDIKNILVLILSPLIYFQFSLDGHLDAFGLPFLLSAILFYFLNKKLTSAFFLGLSFSIKPIAIVLIPIFILNEKSNIEKLKFLLISLLSFFIQFIPYIFSSNPFEAFIIYSKNWMYNGFIFTSINSLLKNNQLSRLATWGLLFIFLIPIYFRKIDLLKKIYFSLLLMIIFSPVIHPWYLSWLLILLPFVRNWSGIYLVSSVSLTSLTIFIYKTTGVWKDFYLIQMIEFIPVLALIIYELYKEFIYYNSDKLTAP